MWKNFDGTARSREETLARIRSLTWTDWKPEGITLHNTAAPTLKQWAESGPQHDARIRNLQSYYERDLGWHAGPHFFVSRNFINWFSNPLLPGVHSRCWNATRFGIEMVGDYNAEPFDSGDGALVRDNAVFLIACLNEKFGFDADDLVFHKECKRDNHDCPGKNVVKGDVITQVKARMLELAPSFLVDGQSVAAVAPAPSEQVPPTAPAPAAIGTILFQVKGKMSTFGGPRDTGMTATEGLALFDSAEQMRQHGIGVIPADAAGAPGLGRRLDPAGLYLACRWDYRVTSKGFLQNAVAYVENERGIGMAARPVDWGPNERTGRVTDLSPGLAKALGLGTDDTCTVTIYENQNPPVVA